jgi:hypothetical protein
MSTNQENVTMSMGEGSISLDQNVVNEQAPSPAPAEAPTEHKVDVNKEVTIPLHLLINLRQILDVSVSRGAYRSTELTSVGKVYDQLVSNINPHLA